MSFVVLLLEIFISSIIKGVLNNSIGNAVASLFIILFSFAFLVDLERSESLRKYKNGIAAGYLFRLVLLYFDIFCHSIYILPNSGSDSEKFYYNAVWQATGMPSKRFSSFISLFKSIFSIIGTNRLYGQFLIVLFSIISICVIAKAIDSLPIARENKMRAVTLVSILPNLAILSSEFLRESIVAMFISFSCFFFIRYYLGKSSLNMLLSYVAVVLGMLFHSGCAGLLIGYTIVLSIYDRKAKTNRLKIQNAIFAFAFGIGFVFLFLRFGDVLFAKFMKVDSLANVANTSEYGGTSYAQYVGNSNSIPNMIIYSIPRLVFFLFSPFPWQWRGIADIIAFLFSSLYYIYVSYLVLSFIRKGNKTNIRKGNETNRALMIDISIITFCIIYVFAWGTANTGTAARHRDKTATLFAVLYALSDVPYQKKKASTECKWIK